MSINIDTPAQNILFKAQLTPCNSVDHLLQNALNNFLGLLFIVWGLLVLILNCLRILLGCCAWKT